MATRRGATIDEVQLAVYSQDLEPFELEDTLAVLDRIGATAPKEYELRFPDCPTIVSSVKAKQSARESRIRPEQLRPEVREAIARTEEYKTLGPGALRPLTPITDVLAMLPDGVRGEVGLARAIEAPSRYVRVSAEPPPIAEGWCPHCGFEPSPKSASILRSLSEYYAKRAENAQEEEAKNVE